VLRRLGLGRMGALDAKPPAVRYERRAAGELLHIDSKKLGRVDSRGQRPRRPPPPRPRARLGAPARRHRRCHAPRLHRTLPDERGPSCAGFFARAAAWFARSGVPIERVMTDNAFAYTKGRAFQATRAELGARDPTTRPSRPPTNGKAERFTQTALREWLYRRPYGSSAARQRHAGLAALVQPPPSPCRNPCPAPQLHD
jgi:hypothetical protein